MATLFVLRGRDQGKRYELDRSVITVGRDSSNIIQLHDTEVSRRHAEIRQEEGRFFIVDLTSSNGTYVNNQRVERHALKNGDRLQIGRTLLLYTDPEEITPLPAVNSVDIVSQEKSGEVAESRIISTVGEQSGMNLEVAASDAHWMQQARSSLEIMYRVALAISHTLDIDELLARILQLIFEWVAADRGCIMLMDQQTGELRPVVRRDRTGHSEESMTISRTILDYVLQHNEGVLTSNARTDERWDAAASIVTMGVREAICVPMRGRYGVVGVIYIDTYTPPGRLLVQNRAAQFTQEHLKLMVAIAHQAALAVEDTFYYSAMLQAERLAAVGQTIATLSHHIKNILQGIRGGSYLIEEGLRANDPEIIRKGWSIVEKNQERISHLVMDMLTYSKPRVPDLTAAQINDVVADVVELLEMRAKEAGVTLRFTPNPDVPLLRFDPEAMHRAILNVVINAIEACEKIPQGQVDVAVVIDPATASCQVIVRDNGEGIAPEDHERIFSVFESRKGARGTGLGLPVSRKILREHGGDVLVRSEPGRGSTFILTFPMVLDEGATRTEPLPDEASAERAEPPAQTPTLAQDADATSDSASLHDSSYPGQ
jgi:two-component system NtrC family sensor kinase